MDSSRASSSTVSNFDRRVANLIEPYSKLQLQGIVKDLVKKKDFDFAISLREIELDEVYRKVLVWGIGSDVDCDTLRDAFKRFGVIEGCKVLEDPAINGLKRGFVTFKNRSDALNAVLPPQRQIGNAIATCDFAASSPLVGLVSEFSYKKKMVVVRNLAQDFDRTQLFNFFSSFGDISQWWIGFTSSPIIEGHALFLYKKIEGAKEALVVQHKDFCGKTLICFGADKMEKFSSPMEMNAIRRVNNVGGQARVEQGGHFAGPPYGGNFAGPPYGGNFAGQGGNFAGQGGNFAGQGGNFAGQGGNFAGQPPYGFTRQPAGEYGTTSFPRRPM